MVRISKRKLAGVEARRPAGYRDALEAGAVKVDERWIWLEDQAWAEIAGKFGVPNYRATTEERNRRHAVCLGCDRYKAVEELCDLVKGKACLSRRRADSRAQCPANKW